MLSQNDKAMKQTEVIAWYTEGCFHQIEKRCMFFFIPGIFFIPGMLKSGILAFYFKILPNFTILKDYLKIVTSYIKNVI